MDSANEEEEDVKKVDKIDEVVALM